MTFQPHTALLTPASEAATIVCTARRADWPEGMVHTARFTNDHVAANEWLTRWAAEGWEVSFAPAEPEKPARPFGTFTNTNAHYRHADGLGSSALLGRV